MNWLRQNWRTLAVGAAVGAPTAVLAHLAFVGLGAGIDANQAPAWAQAVLSAMAVWAAAWLQDRSAARKAARELEGRRGAAVALGFMALHRLRGAISGLVHRNPPIGDAALIMAARGIRSALPVLLAFPGHELGHLESIRRYSQIAGLIDMCAGVCERVEASLPTLDAAQRQVTRDHLVFTLRSACGQIERKLTSMAEAFAVDLDDFPKEIGPDDEIDLNTTGG